MSGPRTKRQFAGAASDPAQRQITSFFTRTSSSSADFGYKSPNQAAFNSPTLPGQVQTDLLTVGMRVRKAVPEGYKTGSAYSAFTLWAEDTPDNSRPASTTPGAALSSTMRELEPFCGLNKVGGLAFQPSYDTTNDLDDLDAMPGFTSSQDTVASTTSITTIASSLPTATTTRKRTYASEEDEAVHDALSTSLPYRGAFRLNSEGSSSGSVQDAWLDDEVSPRSLAPPAGLWENARVLAVPRRPKQGGGGGGQKGAGQENVMVVVRAQDGNDFEEASFLDFGGLGGEGRMEVE